MAKVQKSGNKINMEPNKSKIIERFNQQGYRQFYEQLQSRLNTVHVLILFAALIFSCLIPDFQSSAFSQEFEQPSSPGNIELTAEESAWLAEHKNIRLGIQQSWAPFAFMDNNKRFSGLVSDIVNLLNERMGTSMEPAKDLLWAQVIEKIKKKELDVLPAAAIMEKRKSFLNFTDIYLDLPVSIITRTEYREINKLSDLKGERIAVARGAVMQRRMQRDYPDFELVLYDDMWQVMKAVSKGKADALIEPLASFKYNLRRFGVDNLRVAATSPYKYKIAFGVRKDWPELVTILNKMLAGIEDREMELMLDKWANVHVERDMDWKRFIAWMAVILSASMVFIAFFVRINRSLAREITIRKKAEADLNRHTVHLEELVKERTTRLAELNEELSRSNELLSSTGKMAKVGGWEFNVDTNELLYTEEIRRIHEMDIDYKPGIEDMSGFYHEDDCMKIGNAIKMAVEHGKPFDLELRIVTSAGNMIWVHSICTPRVAEGKTIKLIGVVQDITGRKEFEKALRESEEMLELAQEISHVGSWTLDMATKRLQWSRETYRIFGQDPEVFEATRKSFSETVHPDDLDLFNKTFKKSMDENSPFHFTHRILRPSGEERVVREQSWHIYDKSGNVTRSVGIVEDITKRLKLEEQLLQSQKMETIGTLAGGIAHDFNNILFPIMGHTEMLIDDIPGDSPFQNSLDKILTASLRARDLVKQILTFARQENSGFMLMKIQPVVKEALKLIRSTIPATIDIKQDICSECGVIKADPTQIHQVIMNLATNAYHAMEDTGGELKVSLKEIEFREPDLLKPDMEPGVYACLTISDEGMGMDKNLTLKIFDPFFTTKEKGKGTGMGLSVVHGIVNNLRGAIQVYSEPGKGTEFKLYFPVVKRSPGIQDIQNKEVIQGGTERILLVDDDEEIITMERKMLKHLGYQVSSRTSSIEALEFFRVSSDKFDMVITDMAMPNMSGDKLASKLLTLRPDIPILLCTGFSEKMSDEKAASLGIKGLILKPILMKNLSQKIREVLDKN